LIINILLEQRWRDSMNYLDGKSLDKIIGKSNYLLIITNDKPVIYHNER